MTEKQKITPEIAAWVRAITFYDHINHDAVPCTLYDYLDCEPGKNQLTTRDRLAGLHCIEGVQKNKAREKIAVDVVDGLFIRMGVVAWKR